MRQARTCRKKWVTWWWNCRTLALAYQPHAGHEGRANICVINQLHTLRSTCHPDIITSLDKCCSLCQYHELFGEKQEWAFMTFRSMLLKHWQENATHNTEKLSYYCKAHWHFEELVLNAMVREHLNLHEEMWQKLKTFMKFGDPCYHKESIFFPVFCSFFFYCQRCTSRN